MNSWELAKNLGVIGKYAIALEFDEVVTNNVIHVTTKRSMFQVA